LPSILTWLLAPAAANQKYMDSEQEHCRTNKSSEKIREAYEQETNRAKDESKPKQPCANSLY
jgi:hypothetical protein